MSSLAVFLAMFLTVLSCAHAATYHVAPGGSNQVSCVQSQSPLFAKATLNGPTGAVSCLQPGDTLAIAAGTFDELLADVSTPLTTAVPSGTATQPTIIRAAPSAQVWLAPTTGSYPGGGGVITTTREDAYITFEGLSVDGLGREHVAGVLLNGSHIVWRGGEVKNVGGVGSGIASQRGSDVEIRNVEVHHNGGHGFYVCGAQKVLEHNWVHDNGFTASEATAWHRGIQVSCESGGVQRILLRYNRIVNHPGPGISTQGVGNLVQHNLLLNNGIGIFDTGQQTVIDHNTIDGHTATTPGIRPIPDSYGIYATRLVTITNNLLRRQAQAGDGVQRYIVSPGRLDTDFVHHNSCDVALPGCVQGLTLGSDGLSVGADLSKVHSGVSVVVEPQPVVPPVIVVPVGDCTSVTTSSATGKSYTVSTTVSCP